MSIENDPMAEIRASFFVECEELLEALNDGLQSIEDGANDAETINIVFRAVHSIKGGAGAFGLEGMVRFAHRFETLLDEVRNNTLDLAGDVLKVCFQAADHLSDLVRLNRDGAAPEDAELEENMARLDRFLDADELTPDAPEIDFEPMALSLDLDLGMDVPDLERFSQTQGQTTFIIRFAPQAELFETGNEPALLLRNLQELGQADISCDVSDLPAMPQLVPEIPHLSWVVVLTTPADESEVISTFEFVEGLCTLEIEAVPTPEVDFQPDVGAAEAPEEPQLGTGVGDEDGPSQAPANASEATGSESPRPTTTAAPVKSVVRVDLERIERLVNLVGELVINQAMLSQSLEQAGLSPHSEAMHGLEEFQRLTRDIQDSVMMIRAQPVKTLFQRMSRIVRETSAVVQKDVRLNTRGETTEVDKTVIERLADPLTHMIRNAVDHGLESSEDRVAAGKPHQGQINLSAAHRSGRVIIEVSDDGGGIDREKVLRIAVEKGLVAPDAVLGSNEIDNLLFLPGFSTASEVSDLSGRGVGMDVVRTSIQALGGRITITSDPGQGTTFSVSLPLTLAILDGMVIQVAGETMVLPLNLVVETMTLQNRDVEMVRPGQHVVRVRSGFVPLFDLAAALGYRPPLTDFSGAVILLIAQEDGLQTALIIDEIQDQRQVVIKGLDDTYYRAPGIAAATILGDGQIALIIDPTDIIADGPPFIPSPQTFSEAGLSV